MTSIAEILDGRKVCICAGSGGVGKTTTSAAIASGLCNSIMNAQSMGIGGGHFMTIYLK